MNEGDEAKVEKERFWGRRGWVGSGDAFARCAESCEILFGVALWPSSLLTWRHFLAMIWDRHSLHWDGRTYMYLYLGIVRTHFCRYLGTM